RLLRNAYARAWLGGHGQGGGPLTKQADNGGVDDGGVDVALADEAVPLDDEELGDGAFDSLPPDVQDDVSGEADGQHGYLQGFLADLVAGLTVAEVGARLDQYANGMTASWEQGYQ